MSVGAPLEPMQKGADGLSFSRRFANADVNVSCVAPRGSSSITWKSDDRAIINISSGVIVLPISSTYRAIMNPALVSCKPPSSSSNVLLAFGEARRKGPDADHIDIGMARSTSDGKSWTAMKSIVGDPHGSTTTAYNNIVPITDVTRGVLHLIYCVNNSVRERTPKLFCDLCALTEDASGST